MSGRKETTVTISTRERDRLYQEAARASSLAGANQALARLSKANERALAESRRQNENLNRRIGQLDTAVAAVGETARKETAQLRTRLQEEIRDVNRRLRQDAQRTQTQLEALGASFDQAIRDTRRDMANAMGENNRRIEAAIRRSSDAIRGEMSGMERRLQGEMAAVENRLDSVQAQVQTLSGSNDTLLDMAREYREMTEVLTADTARYRCELLVPGGMAEVAAAIEEARGQLALCGKAPTNAPVAQSYARQAFAGALAFHQRVLHAEQAWQMDLGLTRQTVETARAQLEASRVLTLPECQVDVDHWTDGDLTCLAGRLDTLCRVLESPEGLSAADLEGIRGAAAQISRELDEAAAFALVAAVSSQDRADTAADLAEQLWDTFSLQVASHGYQAGDQRGAHRIHLKNPATGFEMVVTQTPCADEEGRVSNCLESDILHYGSYEHNAEEADELARRVLAALGGEGLEQSAVRTVPGYERRASDRAELTERERWDTESPSIPGPLHHPASGGQPLPAAR